MKLKYTIEWLDEWGQVYETLESCCIEEVRHYRQDAKQMHLYIRVTNNETGKQTEHNYLDSILYAEK